MVQQDARQSPSPLQRILAQKPLVKIATALGLYAGILSVTNYEKPLIGHPIRTYGAPAVAAIVREQMGEYCEIYHQNIFK